MVPPHVPLPSLIAMSSAESASQGDLALIRRIAYGDVEAFSAFYDRSAALMFSVAHRILGSNDAAEAGVQSAFTAVWNDAHKVNSGSVSPLAWAIGLTRRACLDQLAKSRSLGSSNNPPVAGVSEPTAISFSASPDIGKEASDQTLPWAGMPLHQRQALELAFFGGLSQPEISRQLGLPAEATKTCIAAGLRQLHVSAEQFRLEIKSGRPWPAK
jgi:RNA polymerase sigma-70 factor (ECF subfamily)